MKNASNQSKEHNEICKQIQLELTKNPYIKLFRNNVGVLKIADRYVHFGLAVGTSDLIGYRAHIIDHHWLGRTIPIFTAIEVKTGSGRPSEEQTQFIDVVLEAGGYAGIARSVEDARRILTP